MTTDWKKLTRRDLATFDTFATDMVLSAMQLGGIGKIQTNGHAKIKGATGGIMTISRDTSAPHCRGNVMSALRRVFPELKTGDAIKKDTTVTSVDASPETTTTQVLECPAKGCEWKFRDVAARNDHVTAEHFTCKWEGCDMGPNGTAFIGKTRMSVAGHVNIRHKGNKPWEHNQEKANAKRAATNAAKKRALLDAPVVVEVPPVMVEQVAVPPATVPPVAVPVAASNNPDPDAMTKLALIREVLGEDPELVKLRKEVTHLKTQLTLVREAAGLDFEPDSEAGN